MERIIKNGRTIRIGQAIGMIDPFIDDSIQFTSKVIDLKHAEIKAMDGSVSLRI